MRIGVDAARAFEPEPTGTEVYARELLRWMPRVAPEVQFTYFVADAVTERFPTNVAVEVLRWPPRALWHQVRLSLRLLRRGIDVLFVPSHTVPLVRTVPTVTTVHDIGFEDRPDLYSHRPVGSGIRALLAAIATRVLSRGRFYGSELGYHRWSLRQALQCAALLTVSQATADRIAARFPNHPPMVVVPHGAPSVRPTTTDPANPPYLLYVGRVERKKNILGLLEGFRRYHTEHPNSTLRLILAGRLGLDGDRIRAALADPVIAPFVEARGYVAEAERTKLLPNARALVLVSHYEGFGLPLLEAFASGVPVLASDIPALREVGSDLAVFVRPDDPESIAEGIHTVTSSRELLDRIRAQGPRYVTKFTWERTAQKTLEVLIAVGSRSAVSRALPNATQYGTVAHARNGSDAPRPPHA